MAAVFYCVKYKSDRLSLAEYSLSARSIQGILMIGTGRAVRVFLFLVSFVTQDQMYIRRPTLHLICWQHTTLY